MKKLDKNSVYQEFADQSHFRIAHRAIFEAHSGYLKLATAATHRHQCVPPGHQIYAPGEHIQPQKLALPCACPRGQPKLFRQRTVRCVKFNIGTTFLQAFHNSQYTMSDTGQVNYTQGFEPYEEAQSEPTPAPSGPYSNLGGGDAPAAEQPQESPSAPSGPEYVSNNDETRVNRGA